MLRRCLGLPFLLLAYPLAMAGFWVYSLGLRITGNWSPFEDLSGEEYDEFEPSSDEQDAGEAQ